VGAAIFIGDELSATGFRLTGIETIVPEPGAVADALSDARKRAALVVMTAGLARHVPPADLDAALHAEVPTLAIVPDVRFDEAPADLSKRLRRALGIET
jgi:vacuolar-type H+-ATPase subunit F/Vma7